jgi:hypothetical protein
MSNRLLARSARLKAHCRSLPPSSAPPPLGSADNGSVISLGRFVQVRPRGPLGLVFVAALASGLGFGLAYFQGEAFLSHLKLAARLIELVLPPAQPPRGGSPPEAVASTKVTLYDVVGVPYGDHLVLRARPKTASDQRGAIPRTARGILGITQPRYSQRWILVYWHARIGYVGRGFLQSRYSAPRSKDTMGQHPSRGRMS